MPRLGPGSVQANRDCGGAAGGPRARHCPVPLSSSTHTGTAPPATLADGCVRPQRLYRAAARCMGWRPTRQGQDGGLGGTSGARPRGGGSPAGSPNGLQLVGGYTPHPLPALGTVRTRLLCLKARITTERRQPQVLDALPMAPCSAGGRSTEVGMEQRERVHPGCSLLALQECGMQVRENA